MATPNRRPLKLNLLCEGDEIPLDRATSRTSQGRPLTEVLTEGNRFLGDFGKGGNKGGGKNSGKKGGEQKKPDTGGADGDQEGNTQAAGQSSRPAGGINLPQKPQERKLEVPGGEGGEGDADPDSKGMFAARSRQEVKSREKGGESMGGKVPEFVQHMQYLHAELKNEIPKLLQDEQISADDVYQYILSTWKTITGGRGLSDENFETFRKRLDNIRQQWAEQPEAYYYVDKRTREPVPPPETNEEAASSQLQYYHSWGKDEFITHFSSEKEQLISMPYLWYVAGAIGTASAIDQQIIRSRGGQVTLPWQFNLPDSGGTANKEDWERAKQTRMRQAAERAKAKGKDKISDVPGIGGYGKGGELPGVLGQMGGSQSVTPQSGQGGSVGPGKFHGGSMNLPSHIPQKKKRPSDPNAHNEGVRRLAAFIPEDVNDTWYVGRLLEEEDPMGAAGKPGPAAGGAPQQQAQEQQDAEQEPEQPQEDPNVASAKKEGARVLKILLAQLKILQKAPDWAAVKQDLVGQLKPYLG